MEFNIKLHKQSPKKFRITDHTDDRGRGYRGQKKINTLYESAEPEPILAGYNFTVRAQLRTEYHSYETKRDLGFLGFGAKINKIKSQSAKITLLGDTTYDGYERTPGEEDFATAGRSHDPEKMAAMEQIALALNKKLKQLGYNVTLQDARGTIVIELTNVPNQSLFGQMTAIQDELQALSKAYERGETPLGPIKRHSGNVELNPHIHPQRRTFEEPAGEESAPEDTRWRKSVDDAARLVEDITNLARNYFPASEAQYTLFQDELTKLLGRSRE